MYARASAPSAESGFVLIAVMLLLVALITLVMSLYGLSSYEAQFFQQSVDTEQAFQCAVGGIERAKFLLCSVPPYALASVRSPWPAEAHVISAVATQTDAAGVPDSLGAVRWSPDSPVTIRVTAEVNGLRRSVEGRFRPTDSPTVYKNLVTTSGGVWLDTGSPPGDRDSTVVLLGRVSQGAPLGSNAWLDSLAPLPPPRAAVVLVPGTLETPALAPYFAAHPAASAAPVERSGQVYHLHSGLPDVPAYFRGDGADPQAFYQTANVPMQVNVNGLVVWLFPGGVRFAGPVTVAGPLGTGNEGCLVIVAGRAGAANDPAYPDAGIRFCNGLDSAIPLILVSDGSVMLEEAGEPAQNLTVPDLAVFASGVRLLGPRGTFQHLMQLAHPAVGSQLDGRYIDDLANAGGLPNVSSSHDLALVPGSWRASNP